MQETFKTAFYREEKDGSSYKLEVGSKKRLEAKREEIMINKKTDGLISPSVFLL